MKRVIKSPFPSDPWIADADLLGKTIRAYRTEQGLTIMEAAKTIGVAKQTLSDIEAGKPTVGLGIILKVAGALGLSLFIAPTRDREQIRGLICEAVK